MRSRPADDPLLLWRGVDDAVRRETARPPTPPESVTPSPAPPLADRPARVLQSA